MDLEDLENEAQCFLLENNCGNIVLNDTPFNKGNYKYASDLMAQFCKAQTDKGGQAEVLVMPLTYLTIIDKQHNLLVSGKGQFSFDNKTILNNDITIFLSDKEPRYDDVNGEIKFYPESQSA
jgi:hypothetical protein